jgi:hypothetical protein
MPADIGRSIIWTFCPPLIAPLPIYKNNILTSKKVHWAIGNIFQISQRHIISDVKEKPDPS